jgi:hypothetical protein
VATPMSGSSAFTVRRATANDASAIVSVLRDAFAPYEPQYTAEAFAATVPDSDVIRARCDEGPVWVALHGEPIVGQPCPSRGGRLGLQKKRDVRAYPHRGFESQAEEAVKQAPEGGNHDDL